MKTDQIEKSPLRSLFWKDEILQVLYWMEGEGFGDSVSTEQILTFLNTNAENLNYHIHSLKAGGYIESGESLKNKFTPKVGLTALGKKEAGERFNLAFRGMQKAGHGECGPECEYCYGPGGEKLDNCVHNCTH